MAKGRSLKGALEREKGVDHKLERQKKLRKAAEKRKRSQAPEEEEEESSGPSDLEIEDLGEDKNVKAIASEEVAAKLAELSEKVKGQADGWETDESEAADEDDDDDEDDEDEEDEEVDGLGLALEDESESESEIEDVRPQKASRAASKTNGVKLNGSHKEAEAEDDDDEEEEDIPLSDIDSLASEDKADVVPHQRLTINNTAALQRSLKSFALPSTLPFSAVQTVVSNEPVAIADVEDDLNRELAFYRQSLDAVSEARRRLKKEGVPFTRPTDYFAEMVKSEEQMGKVRSKMLDEAARKKASADARRQRDLKKFGKAVQVAKLQERQKEKRETLDRIQTLKRKRQGADLTTNEESMFDVALEDAAETASKDKAARRAKGAEGPNRKRQKKDSKFGFGGKKRFAKSNDSRSAGDTSSYSVKKMKGSKGAKSRPGKSKRARMS